MEYQDFKGGDNMIQIITGSIFILVGIIILFFTLKILLTDLVTHFKGIDTIADVVSAKEDSDGMLNVKISYNTDSGKQTDRIMASSDSCNLFYKGSSITIRYNPGKPFIYKITEDGYKPKTTLGLSKGIWNTILVLLIGVMIAFIGSVVLFDSL